MDHNQGKYGIRTQRLYMLFDNLNWVRYKALVNRYGNLINRFKHLYEYYSYTEGQVLTLSWHDPVFVVR